MSHLSFQVVIFLLKEQVPYFVDQLGDILSGIIEAFLSANTFLF